MKRIRNFVQNTFKNLPKAERDRVVEEITEMLIEKVEDLMEKGYSLDDAVDKTVVEFGDAEDYLDAPIEKPRFRKRVAHYRNDIFFSVVSVGIIIGIMAFINLTFSEVLWFIVPSLALLFWPLALIYRYLNRKETERGEKDDETSSNR